MLLPQAAILGMLLLVPAIAAEQVRFHALGADLGWGQGIAGVQWDRASGAGARYWYNGTDSTDADIILTVCVATDAGTVEFCERQHVAP